MSSPITKHYITSNQKEKIMKMLPKVTLYASVIILDDAVKSKQLSYEIIVGNFSKEYIE